MTGAAVAGTGLAAYRYACPWLSYDIKTIRAGQKVGKLVMKDMTENKFLIDFFEDGVAEHPEKLFIIFEGREYSYQLVDQMANKVANSVNAWGLQQGDTVALVISNEPAFVWTFLGKQYFVDKNSYQISRQSAF